MCGRIPENLNVSGSIGGAEREVLICCCGCKQLIRKSARCLLTGRDSGGAAGGGAPATSPPLSSLPAPPSSTPQPPEASGEARGVGAELGLSPPPPPHPSRTTLSLLNAISPPPVARPRLISPSFHPVFPPSASLPLARAASSHVPDLLINKPRRSSSAFPPPPPPLPVFHFEARCQTELPFSLGSIARETWLPRLPLFPLHLRHPFIAPAARSLAQFSPPTSAVTKKIQRSSNFLVLTRDL